MAGLLGTTAGAMLGRPLTDFLAEEFRGIAEALIDRQPRSPGERVDMCFHRVDGGDLWTLVAASPIVSPEGSYVGSMLNVSDVTGKRAAQNLALQNQKLEAIGAFAAGITHDFNNLLTAIRGYAELARTDADEETVRSDLDQVIASADRASAITGKLLAFTRRQVLKPVTLDPAHVIAEMRPLLTRLLPPDVSVELDLDKAHARILMDPVALEQVIVNLAVNAGDAMPSGGTFSIRADQVDGHGRQALGADSPRPPSVRLRIGDTGVGMDEPTLARIFDPFFTTKELGKGTGLGLSIVYGLVTQSKGQVQVESGLGQGTTFTVLLPLVPDAVEAPRPIAVDPPVPVVGIVLMVEDDPTVREFARRVLARAGHVLITAGDGEEALAAGAAWQDRIDVLLTDIVMPGMRGPVLAAKLRMLRPDIRVIFMSGYAADALPGRHGADLSGAFLPKPFTAAGLAEVIAREVALGQAARLV